MIERCLILDTETTTLDPKTGSLIEVAAILYSVTNRSVLASGSSLVYAETNDAERINRISVAALAEAQRFSFVDVIRDLAGCADVVAAHNAEFDRLWLDRADFGDLAQMPWVCTAFDFDWPAASREAGSLVGLALDHGVGVGSAHRALADCLLIAELFTRMPMFGRNLQTMFDRAMRPKATFQALVSYDDREKAKECGFKWNPDGKRWTRRMAIEDAAALPFKVLELKA